jgi:hypothetical protein
MLTFFHSDFQLDLTHLKVTFTETNQFFVDEFSTEITFPFTIDLLGEFAKNANFSTHYNAAVKKTVYPGKLYRDGEIIEATLIIKEGQGNFASAMLKAGMTSFPNFNKKLSELPLGTFDVPEIAAHAKTIIPQNYPAVTYNFPMVHTDKYKDDSAFSGFLKIINNYKEGEFFENIVVPDNIDVIKNIMQPMVYVLHVLKTAIESAGFTLHGDILNDYDFLRALLFVDAKYYFKNVMEQTNLKINVHENEEPPLFLFQGIWHYRYFKEVTIDRKGYYTIYGKGVISKWIDGVDFLPVTKFDCLIQRVSGSTPHILFHGWDDGIIGIPPALIEVKEYDIVVGDFFEPGDKLQVQVVMPLRFLDYQYEGYPNAIDINIFPLRYLTPSGDPIPNVLNLDKIDLPKVVPDITVGELVTFIKNAKNYSFIADGDEVWMNRIKPQIDRSTAVEIIDTEVEEPKQLYHEERSFELMFTDGDENKEYKYDKVFIDAAGIKTNDYSKTENTNTISINGLPLPVITRENVTTAYALDDDDSKIRLIFYNGIIPGGTPVSFDNSSFKIPNLLLFNYLEWLNFRINSIGWEWNFVISVQKFQPIKIQSLIYCYRNYHLFTEMEKERLNDEWWLITAKSESLLQPGII